MKKIISLVIAFLFVGFIALTLKVSAMNATDGAITDFNDSAVLVDPTWLC